MLSVTSVITLFLTPQAESWLKVNEGHYEISRDEKLFNVVVLIVSLKLEGAEKCFM